MSEERIRIGYALNPKKLRKPNDSSPKRLRCDGVDENLSNNDDKAIREIVPWSGGGLADFLMNSHDSSIDFTSWNPSIAPELQPFFNVIIHKLTEDIEKEESRDKLAALTRYLEYHRGSKLLDPLNSVRMVTSRMRTCSHLSSIEELLGAASPFTQPKHIFLTSNPIDNEQLLLDAKLQFPLICKPFEACGTATSHSMAVIMSDHDLHMAPSPCIAQEFIDHGGEFFKVYNIDEEVMVFKRDSLPDLGHLSLSSLKSVAFDSRHQYPTLIDFLTSPPDQTVLKEENQDRIEQQSELQEACQQTAALIREHFGLTLFGFDCLLPLSHQEQQQKRNIVVVDINYFPSYKEVADFPVKLRAYLLRLAARK
jgi:hypothetical protein